MTRTNEVHKCEEAKLVLEETFTTENEKGEHRELTGEATIEASSMLHIGLSNHVSEPDPICRRVHGNLDILR